MKELKSDDLISRVIDIIKKNKDFFIITHDFPDGDSLGSQVSLYTLLKSAGKNAYMVCDSEIPYQYEFLPSVNQIRKNLQENAGSSNNSKYICFCLDSADEGRFKISIEKIREKAQMIINIDHHPGNAMYGDINIVDPEKSATAEILYDIIVKGFPELLDYNISLGIYTAILTDTGRFQYSNTTHSVHRIASHLLELGVVPAKVFSCIYENEPFRRFELLAKVLKRIKLLKSKKLIYSFVLKEDFDKLGLPFSANDGIIEILRSASEAKISAFIKQVEKNNYKVSLRSSDPDSNVAEIALKFGGGGHKMASAYSCSGTLKEVLSSLIKAI
ncbi:MAG: Bifunctional oligoribonuclease and PAP phosphatase NrnA [Actinobacteria bacterium ADurb.Bin346]|nr:MAG: Bifunctional oligoribonuclease and PAP phosphatase NrnA [Actinobacteria bacterium ADurb.Bin346]